MPLRLVTATDAPRGHEFVEHTADLGIRAWGPDVGAAFAEAALGLFGNMVDLSRAEPKGEAVLELEADSPERLLYQFLDELLFRHQRDLLVFSGFDVTVSGGEGAWRLRAVVRGEDLDAERHGHVHEVKAITYHELRVSLGPPAEAFVVVDI